MKPGGSILLLKLTKLTNLTKPKLMKKNVLQIYGFKSRFSKYLMLNNCKIRDFLNVNYLRQ